MRLHFLPLLLVLLPSAIQCRNGRELATQSEVRQLRQEIQLLKEQYSAIHELRKLQESGDGGMEHNHADHGGHGGDVTETSSGDHSGDHGDGDGGMNSGASSTAHSGHSSGGHRTYFTSGKDDITIFFKVDAAGWSNLNWAEYVFSCIFVIALGIFVEWLATLRVRFILTNSISSAFAQVVTPRATIDMPEQRSVEKVNPLTIKTRLIAAALYFVGVTLSYCIMLVVMTFNLGLFISAVLGLTIGYFVFGLSRSQTQPENDSTECCHNAA